MTFGSLFAGIGGFDLGFERAGMRCVWQVEIDEYCQRVLKKHWPNVPKWDDVLTFTGGGFERPYVICGGPPCQRTSVAAAITGKRTGFTLWPSMRNVIRIFRPEWAVVEQPPGNAAWETTVKNNLEEIGYHPSRLQLSACRSGAPHQRRRVFVLANPMRQRCDEMARIIQSLQTRSSPWSPYPGGTWREAGTGRNRMVNGFSDWVDRLKALGNAVVPQVAERIGICLMGAQ